jgi:hypothetical protein
MDLKARWKTQLKVMERWPAPPAGRAPVFVHEVTGLEGTLSSGSSPPATKVGSGDARLIDGSAVIDLTTLKHPSGTTVDCTGLKVRRVLFRARATNSAAVTITADEEYGYELKWNAVLDADEVITRTYRDSLAVVSATAKWIALSSDDADAVVDFVIVAG